MVLQQPQIQQPVKPVAPTMAPAKPGAVITPVTPAVAPAPGAQPIVPGTQMPKKKKKWWIWLIVAVVVIGILLGLAYAFL